jgi:biopolymer transport protein ExbD
LLRPYVKIFFAAVDVESLSLSCCGLNNNNDLYPYGNLVQGHLIEKTSMQIESRINEQRRAGVKRSLKHNLRIDMTPMVDLGFLLIAFFIVTTELSRPTVMNLYMPHDGPSMPVKSTHTITFLLDKTDKLYYYSGEEKEAVENNKVFTTHYNETELGKIVSAKQQMLDQHEGREKLVVLIKPGKNAAYKNLVDVLDEMTIHEVKRYAIVVPGSYDLEFLKKH